MMERIGIRELRQDLSNQVKNAARGESVVITVDGQPQARLVPFIEDREEVSMEQLIATGRVIPARRRQAPAPAPPPRIKGLRPSQEVLDELREDRI